MFNLNRVTLQNDNNKSAKTQSLQNQKHSHLITKVNLACVFKNSDTNTVNSVNKSFENELKSKYSKN